MKQELVVTDFADFASILVAILLNNAHWVETSLLQTLTAVGMRAKLTLLLVFWLFKRCLTRVAFFQLYHLLSCCIRPVENSIFLVEVHLTHLVALVGQTEEKPRLLQLFYSLVQLLEVV